MRRGAMCVLAGLFLLLGSGVALGKGPESGVISGPSIEPVDVIESGSHEFGTGIMGATRLWSGSFGFEIDEPQGGLGSPYTMTWVNMGPPGDPIEHRTIVQYLYVDAEDGPVIHTPEQVGLEGWGPEVIGWFAAPADLEEILRSVGVPELGTIETQPVDRSIPITSALVAVILVGATWLLSRRRLVATGP